jgi:Peptidase family M28
MAREKSPIALVILTILAFELLPFFAIRSLRPPDPVPDSAPETKFSSARAAKHVAALAKEPHPPGTPAHAHVREYIVGELEKLGLAPIIKKSHSIYANGPSRDLGDRVQTEVVPLQNIVARVPGTSSNKAILLSAHYDTCLPAPGAGDDSAGVAAILETVRALRAAPRLKNDVIVLFSDGEEQGLLGALEFVSEDEWARDVGLALNFDARGNSGPSIMFETSGGTVPLIRAFARAAPHAVANSLTDTVYQRLPNGTDFTHFKQHGIAGFNFACVDGWRAYHTPLDTPAHLSEATLQHHGTYALALTRHFGDMALTMSGRDERPDAIYFNPWGGVILCYESFWALPLSIVTAAVFAAIVVAGLRRGYLRPWPLGRGAFAALSWSILIPMVVTIGVVYLGRIADQATLWTAPAPHGENLVSVLMTLSLWNVALCLVSLLYQPGRMRTAMASAALGYAFLWLVLCLLMSIFVSGASFLFTWPLLIGLGGYGITILRNPDKPLSALKQLAVLLCGMPAIVLLTQAIYLFFVGLAPHEIPGVFVPMMLSVLTLGLLLPQLQLGALRGSWTLPAAGMFGAMVCFVGGRLATGFGI